MTVACDSESRAEAWDCPVGELYHACDSRNFPVSSYCETPPCPIIVIFLTKVPHSPSFTLQKVHPATEGIHSVTLPLQPGACHVERYAMIISNLRIAGHRRAAETNNYWTRVTELMRDTATFSLGRPEKRPTAVALAPRIGGLG